MKNKKSEAVIYKIREMSAKKGPPGLKRMNRLLEMIDNPQDSLAVIHVAGTNGKGSTICYLSEILQAAGYKTGVYTSPHVMVYNERFKVNREQICDEEFCYLAEKVLCCAEKIKNEGFGYLAEFEILTAIAFLFFKKHSPDFVILEAGLGGRMDMTNVIKKPLLSIITQIGLDHTEILGETLPQIAREKAGIIKQDIPIVSESSEYEVQQVISSVAKKMNAPFIDASAVDFCISQTNEKTVFSIKGEELYQNLVITMLGEHQVHNAITAICGIENLKKRKIINVKENAIRKGLETAHNLGRFEVLCRAPYLIIDGAHNVQGIDVALSTLKTYFGEEIKKKKVLIVFGCFRDKDYKGMVKSLIKYLKILQISDVLVTEPVTERALLSDKLVQFFKAENFHVTVIPNEQEAYDFAKKKRYDVTLFLGSIYLIGDIRLIYQKKGW